MIPNTRILLVCFGTLAVTYRVTVNKNIPLDKLHVFRIYDHSKQ
jgi:hypothetical protein